METSLVLTLIVMVGFVCIFAAVWALDTYFYRQSLRLGWTIVVQWIDGAPVCEVYDSEMNHIRNLPSTDHLRYTDYSLQLRIQSETDHMTIREISDMPLIFRVVGHGIMPHAVSRPDPGSDNRWQF